MTAESSNLGLSTCDDWDDLELGKRPGADNGIL